MESGTTPTSPGQGLPLRRLRDLTSFEVADDNPDVRGWSVRGADGRQFGQVHELIVDTEALKVRYLDVVLDESQSGGEPDRHILLPIGVAALDEDGDNVFVPSLTAERVLEYPPYVEIQITRQYEEAMLRTLNLPLPPAASAGFYSQPSYDDHTFYQRRRLQ